MHVSPQKMWHQVALDYFINKISLVQPIATFVTEFCVSVSLAYVN